MGIEAVIAVDTAEIMTAVAGTVAEAEEADPAGKTATTTGTTALSMGMTIRIEIKGDGEEEATITMEEMTTRRMGSTEEKEVMKARSIATSCRTRTIQTTTRQPMITQQERVRKVVRAFSTNRGPEVAAMSTEEAGEEAIEEATTEETMREEA